MKKVYTTPTIDVIQIEIEESLLALSDRNNYLESLQDNGTYGDW